MMTCYRPLSAALVCVFLAVLPARGQTSADPSGHWEGKIQMPNHELPVAIDLAKTAAGDWIGSVSIPGSVTDVPLSDVAMNGQTVQFSAGLPGKTTFDGNLSADASGLNGTVSNVEGGVPFQLTRAGEASVKLPPRSSMLPKAFDGTWEGIVDRDGKSRRVLIRLWPAADGQCAGHNRGCRPRQSRNPRYGGDAPRQRAGARRTGGLRYLSRHAWRRRRNHGRVGRAFSPAGAHH